MPGKNDILINGKWAAPDSLWAKQNKAGKYAKATVATTTPNTPNTNPNPNAIANFNFKPGEANTSKGSLNYEKLAVAARAAGKPSLANAYEGMAKNALQRAAGLAKGGTVTKSKAKVVKKSK